VINPRFPASAGSLSIAVGDNAPPHATGHGVRDGPEAAAMPGASWRDSARLTKALAAGVVFPVASVKWTCMPE
jgi:hypothetical protein